jgi:hypothetical protein
MRTRAFAEALVPLVIVGALWLLFLVLVEGLSIKVGWFALAWLTGALPVFPVLLLFVAPAPSTQLYLWRPLVPIALLFVPLRLGLLENPSTVVATCLPLTAVSLLLVDWTPSLPRLGARAVPPPEARRRVGRSPETQLRRDFWLRPFPAAAALLSVQALLVGVDQFAVLPRYGFFFASLLVFSFSLSLVAMRPLGLDLIASSLAGKSGLRLGDFGRAWSVLPVRREAVARGVYVHGMITGVAIGTLFLGANLLTTWLRTGEPRFIDASRAPGPEFFLPFAAAIPCLAGALTAGAMGDRVRGILSLTSMFVVFVSHVACLILQVSPPLHGWILIVIAMVGGLPPLIHALSPRE